MAADSDRLLRPHRLHRPLLVVLVGGLVGPLLVVLVGGLVVRLLVVLALVEEAM